MAAVMSSSAIYDLGDLLMKNQASGNGNAAIQQRNNSQLVFPQQSRSFRQQQSNPSQQQQKFLRLNSDLFQQLPACFPHAPAVRRVSSGGGGGGGGGGQRINPGSFSKNQTSGNLSLATATLVNSVANLLPALETVQNQNLHRKLDRSQSEPAKIIQVPQIINSSRYKTELCRPYEESGACKYGDKCQFAHGSHELRSLARHPKYKTELCRTFHTIGFCPYGPRCHFVHNAEEARPSAAVAAQMQRRPTPLNIAAPFSGSLSGTPSPSSSLSQSPTTSYSSFFSEDNSSVPCDSPSNPSPPPAFAYVSQVAAAASSASVPPPPPLPPRSTSTSPEPKDDRLLVFNLIRLSLEDLLA